MTENLYNEEKLRGFLLGDLSESERAAIEERFLADEDFSAQVHVVEDELIESYLRHELSARDHQRFEAAFLTQPRRRERVLVMKGVLAAVSAEALLKAEQSPSLWAGLLAFFRFESAFAPYAVAAGVLFVLAFGALLLFNKLGSKQNGPLARQNTNAAQPAPVAALSPLPSPDNSQSKQTPSPAVTPVLRASPSPVTETAAGPTLATILLRPTLVRDPVAANKLIIGSSVKQVRLQLTLERNDYKSYLVNLTTVDGHSIWKARPVHARTTTAGASVVVSIPSNLLATDDYLVELSGVSDAGRPPESLANYFFSVARASRP